MTISLRRLLIALLLLPLIAVTGCTGSTQNSTSGESDVATADDEQLQVIATFLPMYLFTKAIAGDAADVSILIEPGTEVHDYQSTPADVRAIAEADVLVKNGLGMEEFLDSTVTSAENANLTVIDASANIDPLEAISPVVYPTASGEPTEAEHTHDNDHAHGDDDHAADEHGHAHDEEVASGAAEAEPGESGGEFHTHDENPHVWLDPMLAVQQVETIRDGLIAADPDNASVYEANAAAYIEQLQELDRQFQERLQPFSDRTFISFHDAYPYLASRYGLQQVAIVALPEDNLTPGDIQNTIATVKDYEVKALFGEPGTDNRLLNSLSQDLNVELKTLDSLESGELDPQYYFTAMENNLTALESAFQ